MDTIKRQKSEQRVEEHSCCESFRTAAAKREKQKCFNETLIKFFRRKKSSLGIQKKIREIFIFRKSSETKKNLFKPSSDENLSFSVFDDDDVT